MPGSHNFGSNNLEVNDRIHVRILYRGVSRDPRQAPTESFRHLTPCHVRSDGGILNSDPLSDDSLRIVLSRAFAMASRVLCCYILCGREVRAGKVNHERVKQGMNL